MRDTMTTMALAGICALTLFPSHAAGPSPRSSKIHPVLEDPDLARVAPGRSPFLLESHDGRMVARVRARDMAALLRIAPGLGVVVRAIVGEIASVEVPRAALAELAALPGVVSIKPALVYELLNDISTVEVGADAVATAYGGTGRGVIVAVMDSGLDFRHLDFRNPDGTSRVLAAWDQTDAAGLGAGCGSGVTFGRCWTKDDLDADLAGGPTAGLSDAYSHGTAVAGTAAGNGRATANGVPSGTYAGVAPEADLIIVKAFNSQGVWTGGDVPAALTWIRDRAAAAGKPFVINMSFGGDIGPHDGTSPEELAIDAFLQPGVTGRAVAIGAGNSRDDSAHTTGTAVVGVQSLHTFQIPTYTPFAGSNNDSVTFDLWYEGGDDMTVSVLDAGNAVLATATRGTSTAACTTSGRIVINAVNATDPDNLDSEVFIIISDSSACVPATPPPSNQTMTIRVTGVAVPGGGGYHLWASSTLGSGAAVKFSQPVESTTVTFPATSFRATSVGAYFTRHCWPNADPGTGVTCVTCPPPAGGLACPPLGELADESSAGPTRDGRLKPELVAPYGVVTSRSAAAPPLPPQYLSPDGLHAPAGGTSFAAPHVAGAMAVLLQFHPQLDAMQLRQMLIDSARVDSFTGAVPNQLYGNGKLGVLSASQSLLKLVVGLTIGAGGSLSWTAEPGSTTYNVYRADLPGSLPGSYGSCLASGLSTPSFSDPQSPSAGAAFSYIVTGANNGIEGSMGFDSAGHQRPNLSPCP